MRILTVALISVLATLFLSGPPAPVDDTPGWLVTPEWLAYHLFDPDLRVLDVRPDVQAYLAGHVPNAVHLSEASLRGPSQGLPAQYLPPELLALMLERAGVGDDNRVVVYSDGDDVPGATMTAYVLEKLGHPAHVLDGGFEAWEGARLSSQGYPMPRDARFTVRRTADTSVDAAAVKRLLDKPGTVFVDARPEPAYRGQVRTWMRNGHIPGALNVEWRRLMDPDNPHRFRKAAELRAIFADKGIEPSMNVVLYCGTSRQASLEYGVLRHILGFENVRLYEGSWTDYAARPELDVERGPGPPPLSIARR
jgi:thiosulfate/3-mercaptopyruvate sulfurtransferase